MPVSMMVPMKVRRGHTGDQVLVRHVPPQQQHLDQRPGALGVAVCLDRRSPPGVVDRGELAGRAGSGRSGARKCSRPGTQPPVRPAMTGSEPTASEMDRGKTGLHMDRWARVLIRVRGRHGVVLGCGRLLTVDQLEGYAVLRCGRVGHRS